MGHTRGPRLAVTWGGSLSITSHLVGDFFPKGGGKGPPHQVADKLSETEGALRPAPYAREGLGEQRGDPRGRGVSSDQFVAKPLTGGCSHRCQGSPVWTLSPRC